MKNLFAVAMLVLMIVGVAQLCNISRALVDINQHVQTWDAYLSDTK